MDSRLKLTLIKQHKNYRAGAGAFLDSVDLAEVALIKLIHCLIMLGDWQAKAYVTPVA